LRREVEAVSPSRGHAPYPQWPPRSYQHRDSSRRAPDDYRQLADCDALPAFREVEAVTALVADTRPTPNDRRDHTSTVTHPGVRPMTTGNWLIATPLPAFREADGRHQQRRVESRPQNTW